VIRAVEHPPLDLSAVHGAVATEISKVAGTSKFNTAGMLWWRSSAAQEKKKGSDDDSAEGFRIGDWGLRISDCGSRIAECGFNNHCGIQMADHGSRI
jgi:hypothetical protein